MFESIIGFLVPVLIAVLKATIKNPKSKVIEGEVIAELAQFSTLADTAVNGTVWSSTSGTSTTGANIPGVTK
jgi:hypothetical protein